MFMIIRYSDGSYAEGVIHRLVGGSLRATIAGTDDAVEYTLFEDGWTSEAGAGVTFEFILQREVDLLPETMRSGEPSCAVGGECVFRRASGSDSVLVN